MISESQAWSENPAIMGSRHKAGNDGMRGGVVRLGTPLSPTAVKVMLLGSGELGKEVAIELQRLGCEVIAVDRYPDAPAMQVAHRSHVIAMTDAAALRAVIEAERPNLVVPEIEAIATDELVRIEAEGLATVIPTARAAQLTMNREGIRRLAAEELGLPTSRYAFASTEAELATAAAEVTGFPCFVKPVMSSSGKGQSYVERPGQVAEAWRYALEGGRVEQPRVIVEAAVDFDFEITQLTVRHLQDGKVATSFCAPIGHRQVKGDYVESWQPQAMSEQALSQSREIAKAVTDALGGQGIFGVELFIKGDEAIFSEVSPRPHDTGLVTLVSQYQSEFCLHARAILGLPADVSLREPGASAVIYGGLDARGIAFEGVPEALAVPGADLRLFGKPESYLRRRMGVALARAADTDQARARATEAAGKVTPVTG
jgi:phosphoribosylglycinamide formyltransferase 2